MRSRRKEQYRSEPPSSKLASFAQSDSRPSQVDRRTWERSQAQCNTESCMVPRHLCTVVLGCVTDWQQETRGGLFRVESFLYGDRPSLWHPARSPAAALVRGTLRIVGCEYSRVLSVSPATRHLLVGKKRHAPPARMMLPESFFATLAASCCPEWRYNTR